MTVEMLVEIMQCTAQKAALFLGPLLSTMMRYQINTPLRKAHFLAQIGHESGGLKYVEELSDGKAYEWRLDLGNSQPGDGPKFKGRGLIQLTGRKNYAAYAQRCGSDLLAEPEKLASDPGLAADCAGWFWSEKNLNPFADRDDIRQITRRINGGLNGLPDRTQRLQRAKLWLMRPRVKAG
jgi:putative chitinase